MYDKEMVKELNALSKDVYGSTSRWKKLVKRGEVVAVMEKVKVLDPETEEVKEEERPVMHYGSHGGELAKSEVKRYSLEEVKEKMLTLKTQRDNFLAMLKRQQEEQKKLKEEQQKAQEAVSKASGSAAI